MSAPDTIRLSSVLSALSYALDLTEGHPSGHTSRTCLIGMRLTRELGLPVAERSALFYALLLKDAGCSSNAVLVSRLFGGDDQQVKHQAWLHDWRKLSVRATNLGAALIPTRPLASWARRVWRLGWHGSASVRELYRRRSFRHVRPAGDAGQSFLLTAVDPTDLSLRPRHCPNNRPAMSPVPPASAGTATVRTLHNIC